MLRWTGPRTVIEYQKILPKLGAPLNVKSARTRAVIKDHVVKNFLALSSKGLSLFCKRLISCLLPYLAMAAKFSEKAVCLRLFQMAIKSSSIFWPKELPLPWWKRVR